MKYFFFYHNAGSFCFDTGGTRINAKKRNLIYIQINVIFKEADQTRFPIHGDSVLKIKGCFM